MQNNQNKKRVKLTALLLALILLLGCFIGGTLAWLVANTTPVVNTFTVGNIELELKEHELNDGNLDMEEEVTGLANYKIIPGTTQPKDPFVRVKDGSENCWVFVQIDESNNLAQDAKDAEGGQAAVPEIKYVDWEIAEGWELVNGETNVYSRQYTGADATNGEHETYAILKDNKVSYSRDLTKAMLNTVKADAENKSPKLTFTAYAIQSEYLTKTVVADGVETQVSVTTAADAWALIKPAP